MTIADLWSGSLLLPGHLVLLWVGLLSYVEAARSSGVIQCQEELSVNKPDFGLLFSNATKLPILSVPASWNVEGETPGPCGVSLEECVEACGCSGAQSAYLLLVGNRWTPVCKAKGQNASLGIYPGSGDQVPRQSPVQSSPIHVLSLKKDVASPFTTTAVNNQDSLALGSATTSSASPRPLASATAFPASVTVSEITSLASSPTSTDGVEESSGLPPAQDPEEEEKERGFPTSEESRMSVSTTPAHPLQMILSLFQTANASMPDTRLSTLATTSTLPALEKEADPHLLASSTSPTLEAEVREGQSRLGSENERPFLRTTRPLTRPPPPPADDGEDGHVSLEAIKKPPAAKTASPHVKKDAQIVSSSTVPDNSTNADSLGAGLIHQINSWRSKYFTVLGFFIAFLIVFVVVVLALFLRLRKARRCSYLAGYDSPTIGCRFSLRDEDEQQLSPRPRGATSTFSYGVR